MRQAFSRRYHQGRIWATTVATTVVVVVANAVQAGVAHAYGTVGQVHVNPTTTDFRGGAMVQKMIDWAGQFGLWGSVGSLLVGAGIWGVFQQFGMGHPAGKGEGPRRRWSRGCGAHRTGPDHRQHPVQRRPGLSVMVGTYRRLLALLLVAGVVVVVAGCGQPWSQPATPTPASSPLHATDDATPLTAAVGPDHARPTTVVDGVPMGFAPGRVGAVAAGLSFARFNQAWWR